MYGLLKACAISAWMPQQKEVEVVEDELMSKFVWIKSELPLRQNRVKPQIKKLRPSWMRTNDWNRDSPIVRWPFVILRASRKRIFHIVNSSIRYDLSKNAPQQVKAFGQMPI